MTYEFRCPIHGFIEIDDWERDIIAQPAFQRLRRIRQLAWTDYIYPGAMHTRFEHSLGVMHVATRLFDAIRTRSGEVIKEAFQYDDTGLDRSRRIVRLAALLHDVGHGPFSHAAEDLMPLKPDDKRFKHEAYSAAIVRGPLREVIDDHPKNTANYGIKAEDVASILENSTKAAGMLFWRELLDSQLDADRMDYLLRDSYHMGVEYGRYDLNRLVNTICAVPGVEDRGPRIGVTEGGWHAAESLVLARYYMFTQVYFHKTRAAYDHHIAETLKSLLPNGVFPKPTNGVEKYLEWDDWKVLGCLSNGKGGEHGKRLKERNHYRLVYGTSEHPPMEELTKLAQKRESLEGLLRHETRSSKSWYKLDDSQVPIQMERNAAKRLGELSLPVANIGGHDQTFLYVDANDVKIARERLGRN